MIKEVWDSVKDNLDNRMKTPFGGALIVGWLIINWEALLLLVFDSSKSFALRVDDFKKEIDAIEAFIFPVLVAAIVLIFYQLFSYFSFKFTEWLSAKKSDFRISIKKQSKMSTKAAIRLLEDYNSQESKFLNAFEKHQKEIHEKNAIIDEQNDRVQELNDNIQSLQESSIEKEAEFANKLERARNSSSDKLIEIRKEFEKNSLKRENELEELRSQVSDYKVLNMDLKRLIWSLDDTITNFSAITILTENTNQSAEKVRLFTEELRRKVKKIKQQINKK